MFFAESTVTYMQRQAVKNRLLKAVVTVLSSHGAVHSTVVLGLEATRPATRANH